MRTKKIDLPNYGVLDVTLDKLQHIKAFFNYYPDDDLRKEEILVTKNENQEN